MGSGTLKWYVASGESLATMDAMLFSLCKPGTQTLFSYVRNAEANSLTYWETLSDNERMSAVSCTVSSTPPSAFTSLANKNVAMFVSADGGLSATYSSTLLGHSQPNAPYAKVRFLAPDAASCRDVSQPGYAPHFVCSATQQQTPHTGFSEVTKDVIYGVNTVLEMADAAVAEFPLPNTVSLRDLPLYERLYGVAVSVPLYRAMQAAQGLPADDQEAHRPNITTEVLHSYLVSPAGTRLWGWLVGATDPLVNSQVNICRSRNGSGVQAAAHTHLMNLNCTNDAITPADKYLNSTESSLADIANTVGGTTQVIEGDMQADTEHCLATATERSAYALGVVGLGRWPTDLSASHWTYRYLRLNGAPPTREAAKVGAYGFATPARMRWDDKMVSTLSTPLQALIRNYAKLQNSPAMLASGGGAGMNGMHTYPGKSAGTVYAGTTEAEKLMVGAMGPHQACERRMIYATFPETGVPTGSGATTAASGKLQLAIKPLAAPPRGR